MWLNLEKLAILSLVHLTHIYLQKYIAIKVYILSVCIIQMHKIARNIHEIFQKMFSAQSGTKSHYLKLSCKQSFDSELIHYCRNV